jgi:hypothetical protein
MWIRWIRIRIRIQNTAMMDMFGVQEKPAAGAPVHEGGPAVQPQ